MTTPIDRRCSLTRVFHAFERGLPIDRGDVINLADFVQHMRHALACIIDDECTIKEARRIAKLARMGEEWER